MTATVENCPHRRQKVAKVNDVIIHACALHKLCSLNIDADHGQTHACKACPDVGAKLLPKVDVVITSHNYGRFLDDALDSVDQQDKKVLGAVIVVDDASGPDDQTKAICERREITYVRTEFRSPHLARGAGFALCENRLVQFLDADNILPPSYLADAAELFAADQRLAIAYPDLQDFGDSQRLRTFPPFSPLTIGRVNIVDTGAVWKTEALRQINAFGQDHKGHEDWWLARNVMRSGQWTIAKLPVPLNYRTHPAQVNIGRRRQPYFQLADMENETVTIFTTFSARIQKSPELWERRKAWLREQTWPRIRLTVVNTSHQPMPAGWMDGLPQMAGVSVYDHFVGSPGLEDVNRRNRTVEADVSTAVAAIYNRMWQETQTEFVLILEDDVFPYRPDAIEQLLRGFDDRTAAVTGKYRQRYYPYGLTVWLRIPPNGRPPLQLHGPSSGIQDAQGTGFGCLMVRRSQMAHEPIQANTALGPYYDVNLFKALADAGSKIRINWGVDCDHAGQRMPLPDYDPETRLTVLVTTTNRPTLRRTLDSIELAGMDEIWLVSDGPVSLDLQTLWNDLNKSGRLIELPEGPHNDWGHSPRNKILPTIGSGYVVHIDDDDVMVGGAMQAIREAIKANRGELFMLQMRAPDGRIIPDGHEIRHGNVGTPMFVHPANISLGTFEPFHGGDRVFIEGTVAANPDRKLHWLNQVIINIRPPIKPVYAEPVGDKVHEILIECGIHRPVCGECAQWRAKMNAWGVQGCEEHRAEILLRLNVEARNSSWLEAAGVAARGYFSTTAILDEAIRRTQNQSHAA